MWEGRSGIMKREHVDRLWMDTYWTSETSINTCSLENPNIHHKKHRPIDYGATQQLVQPKDTIPPLNEKVIKRIQVIVGALLYVGRAVNNKLLVALSAIGSHQTAATEDTAAAIGQLLDYVATYPNDGILFRKSDVILAAHADAGFLN